MDKVLACAWSSSRATSESIKLFRNDSLFADTAVFASCGSLLILPGPHVRYKQTGSEMTFWNHIAEQSRNHIFGIFVATQELKPFAMQNSLAPQ
jgi:hypothetical protein